MNKKPIKRNENILKLSKEHHFSLLFCWKIRQGLKNETTTNRIIQYVQYFSTHFLMPHFREEEDFLFALLDDAKVEKATEHHKVINSLIAELSNNNEINSRELLQKIAGMVDDHIHYEERELFPYLEKKLSDDQLEAVGKQLMDENTLSGKDEYQDEFWIKK
jgi:hemerythrin-like domain-containing protein